MEKKYKLISLSVIIFILFSTLVFAGTLVKKAGVEEGYTWTETIADGTVGTVLEIHALSPGSTVSCCIVAGAGSGTVYTTFRPPALVALDAALAAGVAKTNANWSEWTKGTVTGTDGSFTSADITGVYAESISGEIIFEVNF